MMMITKYWIINFWQSNINLEASYEINSLDNQLNFDESG
jgi:hypothetical protein